MPEDALRGKGYGHSNEAMKRRFNLVLGKSTTDDINFLRDKYDALSDSEAMRTGLRRQVRLEKRMEEGWTVILRKDGKEVEYEFA